MKKLFKIILPVLVILTSLNFVKADPDSTFIYPTYQLRVTNYTYTPNTFEFDIYLKHTNPAETIFQLAGHQYFFRINQDLLPQGTLFTYKYVTDGQGVPLTDIPTNMIPRNPSVVGNLLRLSANALPGAGSGYIVDTAGIGVRVLRMRVGLSDTNQVFNLANYNFAILDTITQGSFFSKVNAYTGLDNNVNLTVSYRMFHIVDSSLTGINNNNINTISSVLPESFDLSQNYPNPFNPATKINFALPVSGNVQLRIYDITGKEVAKLVDEIKPAGYYSANFNGSNFASGVYFYRIDVSGEKEYRSVRRMVLIK